MCPIPFSIREDAMHCKVSKGTQHGALSLATKLFSETSFETFMDIERLRRAV